MDYLTYISFTVPGVPKGKARPKFRRTGNFVQTYTPKETVEREQFILGCYNKEAKGMSFEGKTPLKVEIKAFYAIPVNTSKIQTKLMLSDEILPVVKPDIDNVAKIVLDALNKNAFPDDNQVAELAMEKHYSTNPRMEIVIKQLR